MTSERNEQQTSSDDSSENITFNSLDKNQLNSKKLKLINETSFLKKEKLQSSDTEIWSHKVPTYSKRTIEAMKQAEQNIFRLLSVKSQIEVTVTKRFKKYQKLKGLEEKNNKLMNYTNDLEECIMCLYRDKEFLKKHIDDLQGTLNEEDAERKSELSSELHKIDLIVKQKEQEKLSLLKELEKLRTELDEISESNEKKLVERNNLMHEHDNLNVAIQRIRKETSEMEENDRKTLESLMIEMMEKKEKYELEVSDRNKAISELDKEKEELITRKDELLSIISKLNKHVEKTSTEKELLSCKLELLTNIGNEMEQLKNETDKQLQDCIQQVTNFYNEHISDSNIIKDSYEELMSTMKEIEIERIKKEIQEDAISSTICCKEKLLKYSQCLEKEHGCLMEKVYKIIHDLSEKENMKKKLYCGNNLRNEYFFRNVKYEQLQDEILHADEKKIELLKCIENLEKAIKTKDKVILKYESDNELASREFNEMLESVKDIKRIQCEKEASILEEVEKIKYYTGKNNYLKYSCDRFEEHIAKKEEVLYRSKYHTHILGTANANLRAEIVDIERKIEEEKAVGEMYRDQVKVIAERKSLVDEKLVELRQVKKRKQKLQEDNSQLTASINELKSNYREAHARSETLMRVMKDQKRKLEITRSQNQQRIDVGIVDQMNDADMSDEYSEYTFQARYVIFYINTCTDYLLF